MAKFAVGDLARYIGPAVFGLSPYHIGLVVTIEAIGAGNSPFLIAERVAEKFPGEQVYKVRWPDDGKAGVIPEKYLQPMPPDSHTDTTTEDPGLTRLKKLLKQDAITPKQPVKT